MTKVLIVEDDNTSRKLLTHTIELLGHTAIQASNGSYALNILKDNPDINLVITDLMMPNLDGRDLIKIMHNDSSLINIPVIMVSGYIKLQEIVDVLNLGAYRFMPKPVDTAQLKEYVRELLGYNPNSTIARDSLN